LVICPNAKQTGCWNLAERIRDSVSKASYPKFNKEDTRTISLGMITISADNRLDIKTILRKLDQALCETKKSGRNQTIIAKL
jgi:diguanylate cyclase (GGDEF)-like protein